MHIVSVTMAAAVSLRLVTTTTAHEMPTDHEELYGRSTEIGTGGNSDKRRTPSHDSGDHTDNTALPLSTMGTNGTRGPAGTVLLDKTVRTAANEGESLIELVEYYSPRVYL